MPYIYLAGLADTDPATVETGGLEFKGCDKINDKEIKSYWSEALSSFANTGGGVLVWGLDARKDSSTQIDKVVAISPHQDAEALANRLRELLVQSARSTMGGGGGAGIEMPVHCLLCSASTGGSSWSEASLKV